MFIIRLFLMVLGICTVLPNTKINFNRELKRFSKIPKGKNITSSRIYMGKDANMKEHPWMVSIQFGSGTGKLTDYWHSCGGVIISEDTVLTAEHCNPKHDKNIASKVKADYERYLMVVAGENDIGIYNHKHAQRFRVWKWISHENFSGGTEDDELVKNDIALVKIKGRFDFTETVNKIELPSFSTDFVSNGKGCKTTGWGEYSGSTLDEVDMIILDDPGCRKQTKKAFLNDLKEPFALMEIKDLLSPDQRKKIEDEIFWLSKEEQIEYFAEAVSEGLDLDNKICSFVEPLSLSGVCPGDSGGPLQCKKKGNYTRVLLGITSYIQVRGEKFSVSEKVCTTVKVRAPTMFTDVGKYRGWIDSYASVVYSEEGKNEDKNENVDERNNKNKANGKKQNLIWMLVFLLNSFAVLIR